MAAPRRQRDRTKRRIRRAPIERPPIAPMARNGSSALVRFRRSSCRFTAEGLTRHRRKAFIEESIGC
jgi:hypothetical protein